MIYKNMICVYFTDLINQKCKIQFRFMSDHEAWSELTDLYISQQE